MYKRQYQYGKGCLSDQLFGQTWASLYRLGDIYPTDAINKALRSIWKFNWTNDVKAQSEAHLPERYYAHAGEPGLFICTWPYSKPVSYTHLDVYKRQVLDTEAFTIKSQDKSSIHFAKDTRLTNASGTVFDMNIDRTVSLMNADEVAVDFDIQLSPDMKLVAYKSDNKITNTGLNAWTKEGGLVSVWMLSMFNPTPTTTVFIPYKEDTEGIIVNDEYFGKIPSDRLIKENGIIYFKIDGKYRSKLGLPASRATNLCGSYDSSKGVLTILWCSPVSYTHLDVYKRQGHN